MELLERTGLSIRINVMLMSGPFSLEISTVILPLMLMFMSLVKTRLQFWKISKGLD